MSLKGMRTFVGFGLGAIQSGLFLNEAIASGNFGRLVVAEVVPDTVNSVRANGGYLTVNVAYADRIEAVQIGPVEIYNPAVDADRGNLIEALESAQEICTAVPGIQFYTASGPESLCRILAAGLLAKGERDGPCAVIYTAENHNHAAEILEELVREKLPAVDRERVCSRVRFLNTVIGKMSGVLAGAPEITDHNLIPMTPRSERSFLVEAFNRILISSISFPKDSCNPDFARGITTFVEKDDLLPFEEAKLFGHNATHALAAYLGAVLQIQRIADVPSVSGLMEFLRRAFIEESGAALIHRYGGIDPLFTLQGYTEYADDLLARMVNPWLADTVERVGRDVERKLGWEDRLVGTLRLGIAEGIVPRRYALGAAAALTRLNLNLLDAAADPGGLLLSLWGDIPRDPAQESAVMDLIRDGLELLFRWHTAGGNHPELLLAGF